MKFSMDCELDSRTEEVKMTSWVLWIVPQNRVENQMEKIGQTWRGCYHNGLLTFLTIQTLKMT